MSYENHKPTVFTVWVGGLAESVDETILRHHFKKFGPVRSVVVAKDPATRKSKLFGYINYHNHEVAEVAAQEMNGMEINGKILKTKGPKKLHSSSHTLNFIEKKDLNAYTDCPQFFQKGDCLSKADQICQFRHFERARNTNEICKKWINRLCIKKNCPKRHPRKKQKSAQDVSLDRCDSHNAYKCYNQCGQNDCNLHFKTGDDLVDHVINAKSLSPCTVCNAVFFDKDEKMSHKHKNEKQIINNNKDFKPMLSTCSAGSEPIGVFWDIENCRVPRRHSAIGVVNKIREKFYPGRREVEFMCVCDTTKEKKDTLEELNKSQINIVHINAISKNAADDKLKQALRRFAQAHLPPATIVLVSGDINFASELSDLRHRHNLRVILIHNKQASSALLNCAHECVCFEEFTAGLPFGSTVQATSNEVLITNLPTGPKHFLHKIKGRLNVLVCNTGGKVISISPFDGKSRDSVAVIRFPDATAAQRAIQRLDKEKVFGSEIHAVFYNVKSKEPNADICKNAKGTVAKVCNNDYLQQSNNTNTAQLPIDEIRSLEISTGVSFKTSDDIMHDNLMSTKMSKFFSDVILYNAQHQEQQERQQNHLLLQNNLHVLSTFSWTQVANSLVQNSIRNYTPNGVDLLVTNLDDTVSEKDLELELISLAREHTKMASVVLVGCGTDNLHALIKVPRLQDAQLCIAKLNDLLLFKKRIRVTFASAKENTLVKMKSEVSRILLETCGGWLPLKDFLVAFKDRYQHAFHVLNFDQIKDLVYVDGSPGHQFISLLHFPVGLLKIQDDDDFNKDITCVLKIHNRRVPFSSILGLYWSYLKKKVPLSETGELLFKLVLMNTEISILGNAPAQQSVFYKRTRSDLGKNLDLQDIRSDIISLLRLSPGFSVPFSKFIPIYHQFFGRQCCAVDYGFKELTDLLEALPDLVQILPTADGDVISFTSEFRQNQIEQDLNDLLINAREKQNKLPVSSLITSYYRYFGRKLFFRNFGFNSLANLVASLSRKRFKVTGCGDGQMLVLCHQKPKNHQKALQAFANEVASLIQNQPDRRLGLHNLSSEYYKHYGKQLKLAELGFAKLNDLVYAISNMVEISGTRDRKTLYICHDHPDFEFLWSEVKILLNHSSEKALLLLLLPEFYKEKLFKPFPLDVIKMNHFLKESPENIMSAGHGSHTIIFDLNPEDYPSKLLLEHILLILYKRDHFKATIQELSCILKSSCHLTVTTDRILREIANNEHFQVTKDRFVQLTHQSARTMFEHEVISILQAQPSKQFFFPQLVKLYTKQFSKAIRVSDFGVAKLQLLIEKFTPGIAEITRVNSHPCISLGKLGKLYSQSKSILEDSDGALLLCNFAPEYQRKYNKPLKAVDYGFQKIGDLVESLSGIIKIYGEKNMKVIVLKERLLNPSAYWNETVSSDADSDVIVESEEVDEEHSVNDNKSVNQDLLHFNDDEKRNDDVGDLMEWWMEPVPDLPQPLLTPVSHDSDFSRDLISFTEFDGTDIRDGGLSEISKLHSYTKPFSNKGPDLTSKNASDDFVDSMFGEDFSMPPSSDQSEPDLMRMLLDRCSPNGFLSTPSIIVPSSVSTSLSGVSETYSCFSALENMGRSHTRQGESYVGALRDIFTNQLNITSQSKVIKPRIAANFNKI